MLSNPTEFLNARKVPVQVTRSTKAHNLIVVPHQYTKSTAKLPFSFLFYHNPLKLSVKIMNYVQASYDEQELTVRAKNRQQEALLSAADEQCEYSSAPAVALSAMPPNSWFSGSCSLLGISKLSLPWPFMISVHYSFGIIVIIIAR